MRVSSTELELQALWYLESLERIFRGQFRGENAANIWVNVAMLVANMTDSVGEEGDVPSDLVRGLADRGLIEKTADGLFRSTAAGRAILGRLDPVGLHRASGAEPARG